MTSTYQNVFGLERFVSIAAGLITVARGVHQGGSAGVLRALGGAAILQRGLSGHCVIKGLSSDAYAELHYLRERVAELRLKLSEFEAQAAALPRALPKALPAAKSTRATKPYEPTSE
ncbi:YgaP family membrane protein [Pseudomonas sp. EL_65y_Pfl2_R95]|uniref:YgaP family membrane protein n=1 Tax=Pseudomonas sp. EL_65y_Pfl2_R95 TaxID=3088698 RepID=UPI0030D8D341